VSKCDECKWWMSFKRSCLLGRSPDTCTTMAARRGDDELVDRMVDMPSTDFDKLRKQWRKQTGEKVINIKKSDEWD